jgi:hypothetical protein
LNNRFYSVLKHFKPRYVRENSRVRGHILKVCMLTSWRLIGGDPCD